MRCSSPTARGLPVFLSIPGENLKGVYSANEYLTRVNLMKAYDPDADTPVLRPKRAVVVGGGNIAMDAVRDARRLGAEPAMLVYRRSRTRNAGTHRRSQSRRRRRHRFPDAHRPDRRSWATTTAGCAAVRCPRMELGEPDASGRRRPVPIAGSEFDIPCDVVVEAIGTAPTRCSRKPRPI